MANSTLLLISTVMLVVASSSLVVNARSLSSSSGNVAATTTTTFDPRARNEPASPHHLKDGTVLIPSVPYHRQINQYFCGDASSAMTLHYWFGYDLNQQAIASVGCTSNHTGTYSRYLPRVAHFSGKSSASCTELFPDEAPKNGWFPTRQIGMAAHWRRALSPTDTCWLSELKETIAEGYPVIVLMYFDDDIHGGTHYRVAVGYTDTSVILHDPWDRSSGDAQNTTEPRLIIIPDSTFCKWWAYSERQANTTEGPYFASVFMPWDVQMQYDLNGAGNVTVSAKVTYPCPTAFCNGAFKSTAPVAEDSSFQLSLPATFELLNPEEQPLVRQLGTIAPGQSVELQWDVLVNDNVEQPGVPDQIMGIAQGMVTNTVPAMWWGNQTWLPEFTYSDAIGGQASIPY